MTLIQSSDLDFDQIKNNLKTYLKAQSEFADYNFEASGLSNILDVLAYNTHLNGLIANVGLNESFLNSAQLRSSVVSHAESLGYYPRSKTSAAAVVNLSVTTANTSVTSITLPQYSTFSSSIDDVSYTFMTLEKYIGTNNGSGTFTFADAAGSKDITLKEGTLKTKTFIVGDVADEQIYIIPDETMDTSTIDVKVFESVTSSSFDTYTDIQNSVRINDNSTVFIVREVPNGFYEITFSDGNVLGKSPAAGSKIVIQYLSAKGAVANNGTVFVSDNQISVGGTGFNITSTTVSNSGGGNEKESITSIKSNAPIAFAIQQRLITAEDYKAIILQRHSSTVEDVISWGGNDNVPPIYGRVYVALKFKDGVAASTQTQVKNSIQTQLSDNLAVVSIDTVFADPLESFIQTTTSFNFDPDLTGDTLETTQFSVQKLINDFFTTDLNRFGATLRRSQLLAKIDDLSPAILNSSIDIKIEQRITPTLNILSDVAVDFPIKIAAADDVVHSVTSSAFLDADASLVFFRNKLSDTKLELVNLSTGEVVKDNVGSYIPSQGKVSIVGIQISGYNGSNIKVSAIPANQSTIKPLRNYIMKINELSSAIATIDYQNTADTLST